MRLDERLRPVQFDMQVHKHAAACHAGFQIVIAEHLGPTARYFANTRNQRGVGAPAASRLS